MEFHRQWVEQCKAAKRIEADFGVRKAMGYLIGEKFLNHLEAAEKDNTFFEEVDAFAMEIKRLFQRTDLETYFSTAERTGPAGHIFDEDETEAIDDFDNLADWNPVKAAETILRFENARQMILGEIEP